MTAEYQRPLWMNLLFASRAEIEAAPTEQREAYYRWVEAFLKEPEACGFRLETTADLEADDRVDRGLHGMNNDWG